MDARRRSRGAGRVRPFRLDRIATHAGRGRTDPGAPRPSSLRGGGPLTPQLLAGVDVGGTFTDVVLFDARVQSLRVTKVPSTPSNQSEGVRNGLTVVLPDLARLDKLV